MVAVSLGVTGLGIETPGATFGVPVLVQVCFNNSQTWELPVGLEANGQVGENMVFSLELSLELCIQVQVWVVE